MLYKDFSRILLCAVALPFLVATAALAANGPNTQNTSVNKNEALPWNQIGAKAGAGYHGDGLSVTATATGARLHCVFQRLDADATGEGLWLASTATNPPGDRFRIMAAAVDGQSLSPQGTVTVAGQAVRFTRPGLVEEYSVSMDGVRQDFVVTQKPAGYGELKVQLSVTGALVEQTAYGAQLVLDSSGRKLAYSRLHATDATGKELPARIEAQQHSALRTPHSTFDVVVNDSGAVYPVRIDPTFSDANWVSMGSSPGTATINTAASSAVRAAVTDGLGNLYIAGDFTMAGGITVNCVAQWNGSSWSELGSGVSGEQFSAVLALAVSGTNLYAGGYFTTAGGVAASHVAQWNGSSWLAMGSGMNGNVNALATSGNILYAGGSFTEAGSVFATNIAQWNGSSWLAMGSGMNGSVNALATSGNILYAGGGFTEAGGVFATNITQWNGSSWSAMGSGVNGSVNALAVSGNTLYAGGSFTDAGGVAATNIAQWNGGGWSALGSGINNVYGKSVFVSALVASGDMLYAGGSFTNSGDVAANNIVQWNGSSWSPLGPGIAGTSYVATSVQALAMFGNTLIVGGDFATAGGICSTNLAQWSGSSWSALGSGIDYNTFALAVSGNTLYAGGLFLTAGGVAVNGVAQWNGSSWSAVGSGVNGFIRALAVMGTNLYVGGAFTNAGGIAANDIAEWNGNNWTNLGSGITGLGYGGVYAMAVLGTNLYVGGNFTSAGGVAADDIAQWNGSNWSPLGSGVEGTVYALAVMGTNLYMGCFGGAREALASASVAEWNGSSWLAMGSGVQSATPVYALAVSGTNLYVGGVFNTAGDVSALCVAQWNGSSWSALGSGISGDNDSGEKYIGVFALGASGNMLYAGGLFTNAGGVLVNNIAQWDGTNWSALGSGIDTNVYALAVSGNTLYAGGDFAIAGGKVTGYAAEATIGPPTILSQPQSTNVLAGSNADFAVGAQGQPLSYQWFQNGNGLSDGANIFGSASNFLLLTNVYVNDPGYYLVVVTNNFGSVTSTVATLTVSNLPLVFPGGQGNLGFTNNQFWLTVAGPAGSNVVVYASTNLQTWVPLATNPISLGSLTFADLLATNYSNRFYRAQLSP